MGLMSEHVCLWTAELHANARRVCAAATEGEWESSLSCEDRYIIRATKPDKGYFMLAKSFSGDQATRANFDLLAQSRTLLPAALDEIEAQQELMREAGSLVTSELCADCSHGHQCQATPRCQTCSVGALIARLRGDGPTGLHAVARADVGEGENRDMTIPACDNCACKAVCAHRRDFSDAMARMANRNLVSTSDPTMPREIMQIVAKHCDAYMEQ